MKTTPGTINRSIRLSDPLIRCIIPLYKHSILFLTDDTCNVLIAIGLAALWFQLMIGLGVK
jgi:hypothetical protein